MSFGKATPLSMNVDWVLEEAAVLKLKKLFFPVKISDVLAALAGGK